MKKSDRPYSKIESLRAWPLMEDTLGELAADAMVEIDLYAWTGYVLQKMHTEGYIRKNKRREHPKDEDGPPHFFPS